MFIGCVEAEQLANLLKRMAKRLPVVVGILLVAALGWAIWRAARPPREPVYDGKPIGYWLSVGGTQASLQSDPAAVPFLIKALKRDSWVGATYYREWLWPKLPRSIQSHLPPPQPPADYRVRLGAAYFLSQMGPIAKPAMPTLVRMLKSDGSSSSRMYAAFALGNLGKGDTAATMALAQALRDKSGVVCVTAARGLWQVDHEAAAKVLREDESVQVRARVAEASGYAAKGDKNAIAVLTETLEDRTGAVREAATNALWRVDAAAAARAGVRPAWPRSRNSKRWVGEEAKLLARLQAENSQVRGRLATNAPAPARMSPGELQSALSAEMTEAMQRMLPLLQTALRQFALAHSNEPPRSLSELERYFPLVAGQKMVGLETFEFVREDGPRPGDALILAEDAGRRLGDDGEVRVYGFSDGRVVQVTSEDSRFDGWEVKHWNSPVAGAQEEFYLEGDESAQERARIAMLGTLVGLSAADADQFFDRLKQQRKILGPRFAEMEKGLTGTPEENRKRMQAAIEQELRRLAVETLGDKGPALVQKLVEDSEF